MIKFMSGTYDQWSALNVNAKVTSHPCGRDWTIELHLWREPNAILYRGMRTNQNPHADLGSCQNRWWRYQVYPRPEASSEDRKKYDILPDRKRLYAVLPLGWCAFICDVLS